MRHTFTFFYVEEESKELIKGKINLDLDWITLIQTEHDEKYYEGDEISNAKSTITVDIPGDGMLRFYVVQGTIESIAALLSSQKDQVTYSNPNSTLKTRRLIINLI